MRSWPLTQGLLFSIAATRTVLGVDCEARPSVSASATAMSPY